MQTKLLQIAPLIQRQTDEDEEEEEVQTKPLADISGSPLQRKVKKQEEEEEIVQTQGLSSQTKYARSSIEDKINNLRGGGLPLPQCQRSYFEPRLGYDFRQIRIHSDGAAADLAQLVKARAFAHGHDVVFGEGQYAPHTDAGIKLLAHELVHTIQQHRGIKLMRQILSVPPITETKANFCKPYGTDVEARTWHRIMTTFFLPVITSGVTPDIALLARLAPPEFAGFLQRLGKGFGREVGDLWATYLNPADSRKRRVFSSPSSEIVKGFINSVTTNEHQIKLVDKIKDKLRKLCPRARPNVWTNNAISSLLSKGVRKYPINFDQPFEIPGNIAGDAGNSDFGPDTRTVSGTVSFFRLTDGASNTTGVQMRTGFQFSVRDAIDFCNGDPGFGLEQNLTIPLSRLEKSGFAYDVPFQVRFQGTPVDISLDSSLINRCWPHGEKRNRRRKG